MTTTTSINGRLGNQIIRNLAVSLIAKKHNLFVNYSSYDLIKKLGIDLFIGEKKYNDIINLTDENFFIMLEKDIINSNLDPNNNYFQTKEITNYLYNYLQNDNIKTNIINANEFKDRFNNNNDLFIHIRLGDVSKFNPGYNYYVKAISQIQYDNIYISTDDKDNSLIKQIMDFYPKIKLIEYDEIKTIQFATTCKNIILSHGSFSAVIGYLSFFSKIYYPEYQPDKMWYGDMFSINGWNKIDEFIIDRSRLFLKKNKFYYKF